MIHYTKEVVKEILGGLLLYGTAGALVILLFIKGENFLPCLLGFLLGVAGACALFLHMSMTLETTVDTMDEERGKRRGVLMFSIRLVAFCIVFYLAWLSGIFNMIAVFVGVLGLKAAVYIRPLIHTFYVSQQSKKGKKGG